MSAAPICTSGGADGADQLLVGFVLVRVLLLSAKHLILAAKQLFLAAKHAVACMSLPRGADRKSTRLNSSHLKLSRMPSSA